MSRRVRVMIVEDEPSFGRTLSHALSLAGGGRYKVRVFTCAEAALAGVSAEGCDILLTDLELPNMDGAELLARVRTISPATRFILMTGQGAVRLASLADCPAEGYLLKPFGLGDFLEVVDRLARDGGRDGEGI